MSTSRQSALAMKMLARERMCTALKMLAREHMCTTSTRHPSLEDPRSAGVAVWSRRPRTHSLSSPVRSTTKHLSTSLCEYIVQYHPPPVPTINDYAPAWQQQSRRPSPKSAPSTHS